MMLFWLRIRLSMFFFLSPGSSAWSVFLLLIVGDLYSCFSQPCYFSRLLIDPGFVSFL